MTATIPNPASLGWSLMRADVSVARLPRQKEMTWTPLRRGF